MNSLIDITNSFGSIINKVGDPNFVINADVQCVDKLIWIKNFISNKLSEIRIESLNSVEKVHFSDLKDAKSKLVNILDKDYKSNGHIQQLLKEIKNSVITGWYLLDHSLLKKSEKKSNLNVVKSLNEPDKDNIRYISKEANKDDTSKLEILMLTANPANTTKLNLDKEHSDIIQKLQQKQNLFNIILKKAVNVSEFKEFTQKEKPDILHFSGHGTKGRYTGIVVQNDDKNGEKLIPVEGLKAVFKFFEKHFKINVVILNACHTHEQAAVISNYVNYVIGTDVDIGDIAARSFSSGFYFQLAEYSSTNIEVAFDSGRTAAVMSGAAEKNFVIYREGKLIRVQ